MKNNIERIAQKLAAGGRNVVFTGAGISTESGIPDFRSQGGIWDKFRPVYYDDFMSSEEARVEYWRQKSELYRGLDQAEPNAGHRAVAELYRMGLLEKVITQNIDGLHQAAGLPDDAVIELHGSARRVHCVRCGSPAPLAEVRARIASGTLAPACGCGGYLKTATISFGQAMPVEAMEAATDISQGCSFFLVVGSTLVVQPAALMPQYAKKGGAFLAIVNLSETPCDGMCDVLVRGKAGVVLPEIVLAIQRCRGVA